MSKQTKQTAVEWLIEQIHKNSDWIPTHIQDQAKAMEKEQIKDAYKKCYSPLSFDKIGDLDQDFDEYYQLTYKEDKQ